MTKLGKWIGFGTSLLAVVSLGLSNMAQTANAASVHAHRAAAPAHAKAMNPACKGKRTKPSGTIKYSDWQFPDTMNPYQSGLAVTGETTSTEYDGLFYFDNNAKLHPDIATTIPTVKNGGISKNGKTYTIHIKPYAYFSNGTNITAKNFKFDWQVEMDKDSGPACSGTCDVISRIDTPNKYTLVYHLKSVAPAFLTTDLPGAALPTSWPGGWSNDPHAATDKLYQDTSFNYEGPNFPTDGPYQLQTFVNNDRITLSPMKYYDVLDCGANVKQLIFVFYSSKAGLIAAAAARQTDSTEDYTQADLPTLKQSSGKGKYKLAVNPAFFFEHFELNQDPTYNGSANPLHNVKVRQALALSLDKAGLLQSALGLSHKQAEQFVAFTWLVNTPTFHQPFADTKLIGQWDPIAKKYIRATGSGQALADAKKLLAETPYKNGFSLDFATTSGNPVRQAQEAVAAANWARLGIKLNPQYYPASKLFGTWDEGGIVDHGQFQVADWAYQETSPDPAGWNLNMQSKYIDRFATVHAPVNSNDSGIKDPTIDKAFNVANHSLNKSVRTKEYDLIQQRLNQNADWIVLYYRASISTDDGHITPYSNNPLGYPEWNAFAWKYKA